MHPTALLTLLLPLALASPAPATKPSIPYKFTPTINSPTIPEIHKKQIHISNDLRAVIYPSGISQPLELKFSLLQYQHPVSNMIYAAYVGSDTGVSFARNAKQFLNLAAKADGATTRLEPVDGNSVWCVKQDCGGAYLLRVKRKKGGDSFCREVEVIAKK